MSVQRAILVSFCLYLFYNIDFQVDGTISAFSMVKARRSQSMKPSTSYKTEIESRHRSDSISSSDSVAEIKTTNPQPIPSTSAGSRFSETSIHEVDLQPLVENGKKVGLARANLPDLHEAAVGTHVADINPARDGLYSRVRSAFLQFSSAVVVGSAIGAGGVAIGEHLMHNVSLSNTTTFIANTTNFITNKTIGALFRDTDELNIIV